MINTFSLVGEHRDDPDRLLLLGDDGRFYGYALPDGPFVPTDPDAEDWDWAGDGDSAGLDGAAADALTSLPSGTDETVG